MSLFGDLPPPEKTDATEVGRSEKRKKGEEEEEDEATAASKEPKAVLTPVLKHANDAAHKESESKNKKNVSFKTSEDLNDSQVESAILKISTHIGNSSKFSKASKLAIQLLESGSITQNNSQRFFDILKNAMSDPRSSTNASLRNEFKTLFDTVKEYLHVFSYDQQNQISVWFIWTDLAASLYTDDTYEFSRVANQIRQNIESLPECTKEETFESTNKAQTPEHVQDPNSNSTAVHEATQTCHQELSSSHQLDSSNLTLHYERANGDHNTGLARPHNEDDNDDGKEDESKTESDPFGLGKLISTKKIKREERMKRKREEEDAIRRDMEESKRLLKEKREGLLQCLQTAADRYKFPWAQTMIDIMVKHAFDHRTRFPPEQKIAIESLWNSVRDQQMKRKHGKAASGKLDVTAFERLQEKYSKDKISIRKGGGSSGRGSILWLG